MKDYSVAYFDCIVSFKSAKLPLRVGLMHNTRTKTHSTCKSHPYEKFS